MKLTETQRRYLVACSRHAVFRLPSGETRLYYDDGTYNSGVGAAIGDMVAAGLVRIGAEVFIGPAFRRWRFIDPTAEAVAAALTEETSQ